MDRKSRRSFPRFALLAPLALAAALVPASLFAAEAQWVSTYDGADHLWDSGQAIAAGPDGSVYVSGYSYEWEIPNELAVAAWVLERVAADGTVLWTRRDVSSGSGGGPDALAVDGDGNLVVLGTVQPFAAIELRKFTPDGDPLWTKQFLPQDGRVCRGEGLTVGADGTVYVAWYEYLFVDGIAGVAKISSAGDIAWERRYGGPANPGFDTGAHAVALVADTAGAIYVAGSVRVGDSAEMALYRYSAAGDFDWLRTAGSPQSFADDEAVDVALDRSVEGVESIVIAGTFGWNSGVGYDLALARYDSAGDRAFLTTYRGEGAGADTANDLEVAPDGTLFIAGTSERGPNNEAAIVAAFNAVGDPLWYQAFDGEGDGSGAFRAVKSDAESRAYAAGWDSSDVSGDAYLVAGFESSGAVAWMHRFSPVAGQPSSANDLVIATDDAVVVTGESWLEDEFGGFDQDMVTVRFAGAALFRADFEIGNRQAWSAP